MKVLARYLSWLLRLFLFVVLLLFAFKNTGSVPLRFFFDTGWDAPLVVLLLAFFALGAALGVAACLGRVFQQRREIAALRRELRRHEEREERREPHPGEAAVDAAATVEAGP